MLKRYTPGRETFVLLDKDYNVIGPGDKYTHARWAQLNVYSVQHTGTNFIHKVLMDAGWNCRVTHWTSANVEIDGIVISPMRDPWKTYITWVSRQRKEDFLGQWKLYNKAFVRNPNLYIVPIDTEDREEHLSRLSKKLKCELNTDWKPVESRNRVPVERTEAVNKILDEVYSLPVVRKFYANVST